MKHAYTFAGVCLIATLIACGGTHSNSGSSTTTTTITNTLRIEAEIVPSTTVPPIDQIGSSSCPFVFSLIDPANIESGDSYEFVLVSYDANGNRTVLNTATGFTTSDTANLYGTLTYDRGVFVATGAQTQSAQTITVTYNGTSYYNQYDVLPHQARVRGRLIAHDTGKPVAGVEIDFYGPSSANNSGLVLRGKVITQADGTFQASVPARSLVGSQPFDATTSMQINNATLPASYQQFFQYNGNIYQTGTISCVAPLELPGTTEAFGDQTSSTPGLVQGNNDLLSVTQCSGTTPVTSGNLELYSTKESTPTETGCQG